MLSSDLFNFYEGKKVLVCGASGMSGHHIYDFVQEKCADVIGTRLNKPEPHLLPVDFTDELAAYHFFKDKQFDYVFICCAQTYNAAVCESNPQLLIMPNVQMTANILRECHRTGVKRVLYISSATVYQPSYKVLSEEDLDLNKNPFPIYTGIGWAKRYMEQLCHFYNGLGLEVVVVRPTNIYGRYDKTDEKKNHVIPALIMRALNKADPYIVYGNGAAVKSFIHANDFARDCAKVMAGYKTPDAINLCSDEEVSIRDVVSIILNEMPDYRPKVVFTSQDVDKVPYRGISRKKFDCLFGKETYISIQSGIKDVMEWFSLLPQTQKPLTMV